MSFQSDAGTFAIAAVQSVLGAAVATYGLIKQSEINQRQIVIAERASVRADDYLSLTEDAYSRITLPTFELDQALFQRFTTSFANYQALYANEAFRLVEYVPDFVLQEGRALSTVQRMFDRAALQRRRQAGKYSTGRARYEAVWFATMNALAKVDAVNHAYRFEEAKKRYYDTWYWARQKDGVHLIDQMEKDAINALAKAQAGAAQGLQQVGHATEAGLNAAKNAEATLATRGNMWGSIASGAFEMTGSSLADMRSGGMQFGAGAASNEPANFVPVIGFGSAVPNT